MPVFADYPNKLPSYTDLPAYKAIYGDNERHTDKAKKRINPPDDKDTQPNTMGPEEMDINGTKRQ